MNPFHRNKSEEKIIPTYYDKDRNGMSKKWVEIMKNSIITTGGKYSTARMLVDYTNNLYMPLCKLTKKYYEDVDNVAAYNSWKKDLYKNIFSIFGNNNITAAKYIPNCKLEIIV